MLARFIKRGFRALGLNISRRDHLEELIPSNYASSPFLPRLDKAAAGRLFYFKDMMERVRGVDGDVVECGVSVGHGILSFMILGEMIGPPRRVFGFDSFLGFPAPTAEDRKSDGSFQTGRGSYASPLEMVTRVLKDGRVSPDRIESDLRLVAGFFNQTLHTYTGRIALLHLDCDLYDSYRDCLIVLFDRVSPGGIVMFDEYEDVAFPGAKKAIDEFFSNRPEKPIEYQANGYRKYYLIKQ